MEQQMVKRRRLSSSPGTVKMEVEVKEENVLGTEYLMAKGRLSGVLKQLVEQSEYESEDSDYDPNRQRSKKFYKRKVDNVGPLKSTYLMKLYDRSVDLAKFEEDTPLYPICRAWMANNNKTKTETVVKRRLSSPDNEQQQKESWNGDIYRLPGPTAPFVTRVPSPIPEQLHCIKDAVSLNYEEHPPIPTQDLMREHLYRWNKIKRRWIWTAAKNEERYTASKQILQTVYTKAQECIMTE